MAITLDLDATVAKFNAKMDSSKEHLTDVKEGYDEIGEASRKALDGAKKGEAELVKSVLKTKAGLEKQAKQIRDVESFLKSLERAQNKTNDPTKIKKYNDQIAKTRAALGTLKTGAVAGLGAVNAGASASVGIFTVLKKTIASAFLPLLAAGAIFSAFKEVTESVAEFEQTAADLSAITGATGDALQFLKDGAVAVGVETTISATDTLKAYKLIASAKPELLGNAAALDQVTQGAISLTESFGGDLPTVATNLTDIMNKFGAGADQTNKFVNALAAGSKEGSADVSQLAASFLGAGTELSAAKVKIEEGVGLFETLAERGVKGSEAGTGLRNVLSKLSATDVLPKDAERRLKAAGVDMEGLSDKSLTFSERLRKLAPIQNDANALTAVFGLENKATAQILLDNIDRVDELTKSVTGTNTAAEQAAIRTATMSGEFTKLKNTITAVIQDNGGGLGTFLALLIRLVRNGILFLKDAIDILSPSFTSIQNAVGNLFEVIRPLIASFSDATDGVGFWRIAVEVATVPLRVFFSIVANAINFVANLGRGFVSLSQRSAILSKGFSLIKIAIGGVVSVFLDFPAYVEGALAAISVFVQETKNAIGQLGANIGGVLGEAFNIPNLIKNGTEDLDRAVEDLLTNPFKGIGAKASAAFTEGFNSSKQSIVVPVVTPVVTDLGATTPTPTAPTGVTTPTIDAEKSKKEAEKRIKEAERLAKERARLEIAALKDGVEKQLALEDLRFKDLKVKLEKFGIDTTEATIQHELNKFAIRSKFAEDEANALELQGEERLTFMFDQSKKEIDIIEAALREANGGALAEEQSQQIALLRKKANDQYLKDLKDFQTKEQAEAEQHEINLLELKRGEFDSQTDFEEFKQRELLNIRLKYAEAQIAAIEAVSGVESDAALTLRKTINEIKGELAELDKVAPKGGFDLFKLIGIDSNDPKNKEIVEGVTTAVNVAKEVLGQVNKFKLEQAEEALEISNKEIDRIDDEIEKKEEELELELVRKEKGLASRADERQQELTALQNQRVAEEQERNKALAAKKKAQKSQLILDTLTQGSALITSAANIFQSVSAIPFAGVPIAIGLIAAMIGGFAAAKAKAFASINKQTAKKGMSGVVDGRSHSQGGERFGDHIEVESREAFGVLSRSATQRWGKPYTALTDALNRGDDFAIARILNVFGAPENQLDKGVVSANSKREGKLTVLKEASKNRAKTRGLEENNRLLKEKIAMDKKANKRKKVEIVGDKKIIQIGNRRRTIKIKNG